MSYFFAVIKDSVLKNKFCKEKISEWFNSFKNHRKFNLDEEGKNFEVLKNHKF